MQKLVLTLFLTISLALSSAMAVHCCASEFIGHAEASESKAKNHLKAQAGHHCVCQHTVADRTAPPSVASVRIASIQHVVIPHEVIYTSLSQGPLLQPPSHV